MLTVDGVFIFLQGNKPVVDYLGGEIAVSETGCVLVDRETFETNLPGV